MNAVLADDNYKNSIFYLEFNIYGAGAEIRLNDIPVYYHDAEGQISSQKPIPESIIDGENILTIRSFTFEEDGYKYKEGAYIEAIIFTRKKNTHLNDGQVILQLKLNPTNTDDKLLENTLSDYDDRKAVVLSHDEKQTVVQRSTNIKSPFPRWAWQDGQVIGDTPENLKSLFEVYKNIWSTLNSGEMDKIRELYDSAAQEFAGAYHYQDKKHGHRVMNTGGLVNDSDWGLADINKLIGKMKYKLDIYANGRVVQIIDQDNRTPIVYYNKNVKMLSVQKFGFYKDNTGEWIMIR